MTKKSHVWVNYPIHTGTNMSFYYKIHTFSGVDEVRRNVATVEPHALNDLKLIM